MPMSVVTRSMAKRERLVEEREQRIEVVRVIALHIQQICLFSSFIFCLLYLQALKIHMRISMKETKILRLRNKIERQRESIRRMATDENPWPTDPVEREKLREDREGFITEFQRQIVLAVIKHQ